MKKLGHIWRIFSKVIAFGIFGVGSFILGLSLFPAIILLVRKPGSASRLMRKVISRSFSLFVLYMRAVGLVRVQWTGNTEFLSASGGKIVIANHPTLLDIVFLISRIDSADCIVKGSLFRFPFVRHVVGKIYISNELVGEDLLEACNKSLEEGNSLVIFPEGTRSTGNKPGPMKRGAARISLHAGFDCLPVQISTPDAKGLRKNDTFLSYRAEGPIEYTFIIDEYISPLQKTGEMAAVESRRLTEVYRSILSGTSPVSDSGIECDERKHGTTS